MSDSDRHRRLKRYGWRNWWLFTPRLLPWWALTLNLRVLPNRLTLGVWCSKDEEDGWGLSLGAIVVELWAQPVRMWSRRERRQREAEFAAKYGEQLATEAADYLAER